MLDFENDLLILLSDVARHMRTMPISSLRRMA
jgi:hypothetical protein